MIFAWVAKEGNIFLSLNVEDASMARTIKFNWILTIGSFDKNEC
jgi:hypothetical protein